jgi:isopentenyl-diphosphate delta-isomerase
MTATALSPRDLAEQVIRVDGRDRVLGTGGKIEVHQDGELHRAFSILVFDPEGRLLLQRRADCKYHFARLWSNTCCGHPRPGESTQRAAVRRLEEELGFAAPLAEHTELVYRAGDPVSGLVEHEYLHVFRGVFAGTPRPDPLEVGDWRWLSLTGVAAALARDPAAFTPWFALLFERLYPELASCDGY